MNKLRVKRTIYGASFFRVDEYEFQINDATLPFFPPDYVNFAEFKVGLTATAYGPGFEARFDNYLFAAEGCPVRVNQFGMSNNPLLSPNLDLTMVESKKQLGFEH